MPWATGPYLSKEPVEFHSLGLSIAAFNEPRPAVDVNQALVVVIVDGWAQDSDV